MYWNHSKPIVNVTETHTYELDERELERILMREEVKNLPVVVVCVTGIDRISKSYLLDYLLKYFKSSPLLQQDGSWMGEDGEPLDVYSRNGDHRWSTWGIRMWPEPFIMKLSSDEKRIDDVYKQRYFWPVLSSLLSRALRTQTSSHLLQNNTKSRKHLK